MKKIVILLLPLISITIMLTIVHVIVSNMLSTAGVDLDKIQTELLYYKKQNTLLHEKVLADTSLQHIASAAAQMGFVPGKSNVSIAAPVPLAKR